MSECYKQVSAIVEYDIYFSQDKLRKTTLSVLILYLNSVKLYSENIGSFYQKKSSYWVRKVLRIESKISIQPTFNNQGIRLKNHINPMNPMQGATKRGMPSRVLTSELTPTKIAIQEIHKGIIKFRFMIFMSQFYIMSNLDK